MLFFTFSTSLPLDPHYYLHYIVSMLNVDMFQLFYSELCVDRYIRL